MLLTGAIPSAQGHSVCPVLSDAPGKPWDAEQLLTAVLLEAPGYAGLGTKSQMIFNSHEMMEENSLAQWDILAWH